MGRPTLAEYYTDKAARHYRAGRMREAQLCAVEAGLLTGLAGRSYRVPAELSGDDTAWIEVGNFFVAGCRAAKDARSNDARKAKRVADHQRCAARDLFEDEIPQVAGVNVRGDA